MGRPFKFGVGLVSIPPPRPSLKTIAAPGFPHSAPLQLAGIIDQLQRQLDQHRADLTHIDGVLRVLATDLDPETIRPKRVYRRNRYSPETSYPGFVSIRLGPQRANP
jgi:hypothetical protein